MSLFEGETFTSLLQEKMAELDAAALSEAALVDDPIEQLRQDAALLVTRTEGRPWLTGPVVQYQPDVSLPVNAPTFDIRFPSLPLTPTTPPHAATGATGQGGLRGASRQGRRIPQPGTPNP